MGSSGLLLGTMTINGPLKHLLFFFRRSLYLAHLLFYNSVKLLFYSTVVELQGQMGYPRVGIVAQHFALLGLEPLTFWFGSLTGEPLPPNTFHIIVNKPKCYDSLYCPYLPGLVG